MKTISKTPFFKLSILFLFVATLISCNKDGEESDYLTISPASGPKNAIVAIDGTYFGVDKNNVHVFFNDVEATVLSVKETEVIAKVPRRSFTGPVTLNVDGKKLTAPIFTYLLDINVSTVAGSISGFSNQNGIEAQFSQPYDMAEDTNGNIYVADMSNHAIRKIAPNGDVSTLAGGTQGFTDGSGANAQFNSPRGIAVDKQGNVFVADTNNHSIRKITPAGVVSIFAGEIGTPGNIDGAANIAKFNSPESLVVDSQGNIFVADRGNQHIRKITPTGVVSTFAGSTLGFADGNGVDAKFNNPYGIAIDNNDNLYVADLVNQRIRKIDVNGEVTSVAGSTSGFADGEASVAKFNYPIDVAVDELGNVFVADLFNHKVRRVSPDGMVSTLAGDNFGFADGSGADAKFRNISGVATGKNGALYIADRSNNKIRKLILE